VGTETRTRLYLISLAPDDRASVVLQDTAVEKLPRGTSFQRTYKLAKPETGKLLEVIATERSSHCSKPVDVRFKRYGNHFNAVFFLQCLAAVGATSMHFGGGWEYEPGAQGVAVPMVRRRPRLEDDEVA
jgi:hypothetical protein